MGSVPGRAPRVLLHWQTAQGCDTWHKKEVIWALNCAQTSIRKSFTTVSWERGAQTGYGYPPDLSCQRLEFMEAGAAKLVQKEQREEGATQKNLFCVRLHEAEQRSNRDLETQPLQRVVSQRTEWEKEAITIRSPSVSTREEPLSLREATIMRSLHSATRE